ncbi:hypothetical protein [Actinosynnema sp. NPDC020468]|uniref:hypothetical protein n=1 Tax=Actinosynnema sp. NPDC020468 TaxID=3154488 RepID=UPI0033EE3CA8
MSTRNITWDEATELFERRGLPRSTWESLYEGEYVLHTGNAVVDGNFPLFTAEDHPWDEETPERDIGYVVDGDLTVSGGIYDEDDGSAALVVLGNLTVSGVHLTCDPKIVVTGNTTADVVFGQNTDKYLVFHGDLRAAAQKWTDECYPDLVGGTLAGHLDLPPYATDPAEYLGAAKVEPAEGVPADVLVPEVLDDEGRVDDEALRDRLLAGLPLRRDRS